MRASSSPFFRVEFCPATREKRVDPDAFRAAAIPIVSTPVLRMGEFVSHRAKWEFRLGFFAQLLAFLLARGLLAALT